MFAGREFFPLDRTEVLRRKNDVRIEDVEKALVGLEPTSTLSGLLHLTTSTTTPGFDPSSIPSSSTDE